MTIVNNIEISVLDLDRHQTGNICHDKVKNHGLFGKQTAWIIYNKSDATVCVSYI